MTAQALHAALLASDSATAVLEALCGAPVQARKTAPDGPAPSPLVLAGIGLAHRCVTLACDGTPLSVADLWYWPALLPPVMLSRLTDTDEPFGRVVRPLGLRRRCLQARFGTPDQPFALEHRALLSLPDGTALAEVWERYGRSAFAST